MFWLNSKLAGQIHDPRSVAIIRYGLLCWVNLGVAETTASEASRHNPNRFMALPCYNADTDGITQAYHSGLQCQRDGLLFIMKEALYSPGPNATVLLWKDNQCSRYVLESHDPAHPEVQNVSLLVTDTGQLVRSLPSFYTTLKSHTHEMYEPRGLVSSAVVLQVTADEAAVVLGQLPLAGVDCAPGDVLRFAIQGLQV